MQFTLFGAILILELRCFVVVVVVAVVAVASTSSEQVVTVAATTAARDHIWYPGVSVASISQYLLVFISYFYESTLNKDYMT